VAGVAQAAQHDVAQHQVVFHQQDPHLSGVTPWGPRPLRTCTYRRGQAAVRALPR
jgi:hypothetical protein